MPVPHTPDGDLSQGLDGYVRAHLGLAAHSLHELDGDLAHAQSRSHRAPGEVYLEAVAHRLDPLQVYRFQRRTPEEPEAAGRVPHGQTEQQPRVEVATA